MIDLAKGLQILGTEEVTEESRDLLLPMLIRLTRIGVICCATARRLLACLLSLFLCL